MHLTATRLVGLAAGAVVLTLTGAGAGSAVGAAGGHDGRGARGAVVHRGDDGQVGRWTVAPTGTHTYLLTWQSPNLLPTTDAQVQVRHGASLLAATVGADRRSISVQVSSTMAPDPSTYDVVLGARALDRRATHASASFDRKPYRAPATRTLTRDPGTPGTHAITTSDYRLPPVQVPGIHQLSEMVGHIVAPVDATDHSPLVLFLHGRHDACYSPGGTPPQLFRHGARGTVWSCPAGEKPVPSYLGYDYVQRRLASQGYVTVSISADAINDLDYQALDGGAAARAALIRDHLKAWVGFAADGSHPADLSDVVLVGHSRGGEGVDRASIDLSTNQGYHVTGQVLIGPTDFGFQTATAMPTVTILPYCDGDVSDLEGQNFTDDGRDVTRDPTHDLAFHSSVLVMGANHNFFNSEWTPGSVAPSVDDWLGPKQATCGTQTPTRLTAAQQRRVGVAYIAGAVHLFAAGDRSVLPMFDGSAVAVPSAGGADVRSHAIGGGIVTARPGLDGVVSADATASVRLCQGLSDTRGASSCQQGLGSEQAPHWPSAQNADVPRRPFLEMGWTSTGLRGGLDLDRPWDLSADSRLDLRTIVDPREGPVRLDVSISDAAGHSTVLTPLGGGNLDPLPGGGPTLAKRWAQDLRVPLDNVGAVDLAQVTQVGLVSRDVSGRVFLADISATPGAGVSTAPTAPLPRFSIGSVRQPEGDGKDPVTLEVPWRVTGNLDHDATVTIAYLHMNLKPDVTTQSLAIPAHTRSGVFPVTYQPNELDDYPQRLVAIVTAYAVDGIETSQYLSGTSVVDDDPTPAMTLRSRARRIHAGGHATWTITLDKPLDFYPAIVARPVKAVAGPQLRIGDLTRHFRRQQFGPHADLSMPIYKSHTIFWRTVGIGRTSTSLSIPTRRGVGVARTLSLRFQVPPFDLHRKLWSVRVLPRR